MLAAAEEGSERRVSKAGYDVTPLTLAKQQELAAGLTPHQRCTPACRLPAALPLASAAFPPSEQRKPTPARQAHHVSWLLSRDGAVQEVACLTFAWCEQGCRAGVGH